MRRGGTLPRRAKVKKKRNNAVAIDIEMHGEPDEACVNIFDRPRELSAKSVAKNTGTKSGQSESRDHFG